MTEAQWNSGYHVALWIAARAPEGWREEAHTGAVLGLMRAARTFDPERGAWLPHANRGIRDGIAHAFVHLRRPKRTGELVQFDPEHVASTLPDPYEATVAAERDRAVCSAVGRLQPRQQEVVIGRYWQDLSHEPIGRRLEVSRQRAQQIEVAALVILRALLVGGTERAQAAR